MCDENNMNLDASDPATLYAALRGVATITLNRPDNKNALSTELLDSLGDHLEKAIADDTVRIIVLTNLGNTFCAGADLKGSSTQAPRFTLIRVLDLIQQSPKPVVARIAGHCMGGGVGIAAACDLSVAAEGIMLAFSEVRLGVAPAIISVVCLPKMRHSDAMELFLFGERISAVRAAEVGLLNYAVAPDKLDQKVTDVLSKLMLGGPKAMAASKQLVLRVPHMPREEAFKWTSDLSMNLFRSEEAAAGIAAFRNRVPAPWALKI
jgi:methylglutaconyl-CoA hydratase